MRQLFAIATIAFLAITACDRSHDGKLDESYETQLLDIVTYTGVDGDNHATFRLDQHDDEAPINLFSTVNAPQKVAKDERILLSYSIKHKASDNSYWDINATSYTRIFSDSIRVNINPIDSDSRRPIRLTSAWRTGEFINLYGQVEHTGKKRFLYMLIDRDTRNNDTVQAYLIHDLLDTPQDSIFYWRDFYLSVNVGVLKSNHYPCKVLRLNLNDANNPSVTHHDFKIK